MRRATFKWINLPPYIDISIHALREESDQCVALTATEIQISIHALREESDFHWTCRPIWLRRISIHALREESDLLQCLLSGLHVIFQSTLSVRRATTAHSPIALTVSGISIHALREESDSSSKLNASSMVFQSTLSVRRATCVGHRSRSRLSFQSTLSVRRATAPVLFDCSDRNFNPRSP